jgi:hypothetical protein
MKTKLMIIALAFGLMSSTCSTDEIATTENECNCKVVHYEFKIIGWRDGVAPIWGYVKVGEENATTMDCDSDTGEYILVSGNEYTKVECE